MEASRRNLAKVYWLAFVISLLPTFAVERYCEIANKCDSYGAWYTLFVAATFSTVIAGAVTASVAVWRYVHDADPPSSSV